MTLSKPADMAWRLSTATYMAMATVASGVLIDLVAGSVILVWTLLRLPERPLVAFRSFVVRRWMRVFIGYFERFSRTTIVPTGDAFRDGEPALVVPNHRSWMDTITIYSLARQVGCDGDVKFIAKKGLLLFPIFGVAGWLLHVVIFITRSAAAAGQTLDTTYSMLADPKRRGWPFWMISYLEGTRRTREKLSAARDFAKKRDLPELEHVLQPRTKGFVSAVHALRGSAGAVYDVTLGYQETDGPERDVTPDFGTQLLTPGLCDRVIHVHQRRIPIAEVPEDEEEIKEWVYKLYAEKDELLKHFARHGKFPGEERQWVRMPQRMYWESLVMFWGGFICAIAGFVFLVKAVS